MLLSILDFVQHTSLNDSLLPLKQWQMLPKFEVQFYDNSIQIKPHIRETKPSRVHTQTVHI